MQKLANLAIIAGIFFLASCGAATKKDAPDLAAKKTELQKLKTQQEKLNADIVRLETEIGNLDSTFAVKAKLVNITALSTQDFTHYIDLQGKISTKDIYYLGPRGQGGQVKQVFVKEGDHVSKGQLVLKLDDAVMLQNLQQLETQLSYAKDLYNRQKNLWDQKIGTEVQLITAKNNVDNLEKQISTMREQWNTSNVYSAVSGIVETVNIHPGEIFTGAANATISIVNPGSLKALVEVPENYLTSVKKGTKVVVEVPDANKTFNSTITLVSQLINSNSRAFTAEAQLPADGSLKPNQLAIIKIQDYNASQVLVIPMTTLQTDETGKYVFVMAKENGKPVAKKRAVLVGSVYGEKIEIRKGLQVGDQLITEGFQGLYDGQSITTS
ncbi:MAG TPA: efflux RND transporter periplasmic adaptor subunit [Puia sp.]|nr:efflux RND transporter periplasmic adaptor subunit [Puia sp.]